MSKNNVIILIGAGGSGKGTLAEKLEKEGYEKLTMSTILRRNNVEIPKVGLVSDDIVIAALKKELENAPDKIVLDGFPRSIVQAEMLVSSGIKVDKAVVLSVPLETLIKRAQDRIVCPKCGSSYTCVSDFKKPKVDNTCDKCNVELVRRPEDNQEDVTTRYKEYKETEVKMLEILSRGNIKIFHVSSVQDLNMKDIIG